MVTASSSSDSILRSHVLPLRDEPKIQTRRSSLRARLKPLSPGGLSMGLSGRLPGQDTRSAGGRNATAPAPVTGAVADECPDRWGGSAGRSGRAVRPCGLRGADGRLALFGVNALGELLHDLVAERIEVIGLAAGDQPRVHVDLLVDPVPAGVADVRLEARPGRDRAALEHVGLDERPRPVTDHTDRLAGLEERANERHGVLDSAQLIGVRHAARQYQPVVVGCIRLGERAVDIEPVALVEVVERLNAPLLWSNQLGLRPGLLDRFPWPGQLDLLGALIGDCKRDLLSLELIRHVIPYPSFRHAHTRVRAGLFAPRAVLPRQAPSRQRGRGSGDRVSDDRKYSGETHTRSKSEGGPALTCPP